MSTYSTDQDLVPVYFGDAALLPDTLALLHEEAGAQIDRDLKAQGWSAADLLILSADSLTELVKPSCCYVMHLLFRGQSSHNRGMDSIDKAKFWAGEYSKAIAAALVETTGDDDAETPPTRSGYVVLG